MSQYVLSLSYGKDSLACLGAIKHLGWPLDRIVHTEVWATDTIPADLPPMVEFKKKADKIIKDRYGIEVEHICALKTQGRAEANKPINQCSTTNCKVDSLSEQSKDSLLRRENGARNSSLSTTVLTYEDIFYRRFKTKNQIYGFQNIGNAWCHELKRIKIPCSQFVQVERERERRGHRSCNTSVSLRTSRFAFKGISIDPVLCYLLLQSAGNRTCVVFGVSIQTCFHQPTKIPVEPVAGSAITRVLNNFALYARTIRIYGHCYSNGILTALLHSKQTVRPFTILTNDFKWKIAAYYFLETLLSDGNKFTDSLTFKLNSFRRK